MSGQNVGNATGGKQFGSTLGPTSLGLAGNSGSSLTSGSGITSGSSTGGNGIGASIASASSRPIGGGSGGLVQRAWNFRQDPSYISPDGSGHGATNGGNTAYRTLDALIVKYVDNVLISAGPDRTNLSGSLASTSIIGSDGVGSYTFSVTGNYSIKESSNSGSFTANDTASYSYNLHESGATPDGSSFTLDESGTDTLTVTGAGSSGSNTLTGYLAGSDNYTLTERQSLAASTALVASSTSFSDTIRSSHAGNDVYTYSENRTETSRWWDGHRWQ